MRLSTIEAVMMRSCPTVLRRLLPLVEFVLHHLVIEHLVRITESDAAS